jgi:hypothetical protein
MGVYRKDPNPSAEDWRVCLDEVERECSGVEARHDIECAASSEPLNNPVILRRRSAPKDLKIRNASNLEILRRLRGSG